MYKFVMMRHGESVWNKENRFTGWKDVELSEAGVAEAKKAGALLKKEGFNFDVAFTSVLKRAIHTLDIVLNEVDQVWLPVQKSWRLNERHYGGLQGLNKAETAAKHGDEQVFTWRRSYDIPPPNMELTDERHPRFDRRYAGVEARFLPQAESLKNTVARVLPYWEEKILPEIAAKKSVLIAAHGNSLRALIKHLSHVSDGEIAELNVPTAVPLVYELDQEFKAIKSYYLGDVEEVKKAQEAVAKQAQAKQAQAKPAQAKKG